jgi:hypothetical protein
VSQQRAAAGEAASLTAQLANLQLNAPPEGSGQLHYYPQGLQTFQNRAAMQPPPVTAAGAAFSVQHSAQALLPAPDKMDVCAESKPGATLLLSYTRLARLSFREKIQNYLYLSSLALVS